jgi:DNA-binding transcriptional LysR family regulator
MTLKQLEAFYWAAKLGTFAIAARRLHVTQSSLSKRIAELEADLGQLLFDRNSRRPTLTAAGEVLLEKAGTMLEFEREIRSSLATRAQEVRGVCRFGLTELAATTWFPSFAARLEQSYPQVVLEPTVALSRPLEQAITRGELDVASIAGPVTAAGVQGLRVAEIDFVWTSSPSRLRRRTVLSPEQFETHPVISNPSDSGLAGAFETWSRANHIRVGKTIQCNSRAAIIALTIAGVGISFQPRKYVQPLFDRGLLVPLESEPPLPRQPYNLIWRRDDERTLIRTIVPLVQDEADFGVENIFWAAAGAA